MFFYWTAKGKTKKRLPSAKNMFCPLKSLFFTTRKRQWQHSIFYCLSLTLKVLTIRRYRVPVPNRNILTFELGLASFDCAREYLWETDDFAKPVQYLSVLYVYVYVYVYCRKLWVSKIGSRKLIDLTGFLLAGWVGKFYEPDSAKKISTLSRTTLRKFPHWAEQR